MNDAIARIRSVEITGPSFRAGIPRLHTPLSVLIGVNGCGKTTLLRAIDVAHKIVQIDRATESRISPEEEAWTAFATIGRHISSLTLGFEDGAEFLVQRERGTGRGTRGVIRAELRNGGRMELWSRAFQEPRRRPRGGFVDREPPAAEGEQEDFEMDAVDQAKYFPALTEFIETARLHIEVPPQEETIRKYEGVVFEKRSGSKTDRVMSFLETISGDPQNPPRIPRVMILAAQVGILAERFASEYSKEMLERDSRTVAAGLRGAESPAQSEASIAEAFSLEERLQSTLGVVGLSELPRFVDISLNRAMADRPQIAGWYFHNSVASLRKLLGQIDPLAKMLEQANRILSGCNLRVQHKEFLKTRKVGLPPDQNYLLVVTFRGNDQPHDLMALSSGQQHMLVLLGRLWLGGNTAVGELPSRHRLLLIDEPEISLHLAWQHEISQQFRLLADRPDVQVVVATHSNFITGSLLPSMIVEL